MLQKYKNIHFRYFKLENFTNNTKLESWLVDDKQPKSKYLKFHTSDALAYLVLQKFAGTYLDFDVLVTSGENSSNFVCSETENVASSSVVNLDKKQAKKFAAMFIE